MRIDDTHVGLWPPLRLTGVGLDLPGNWRLSAKGVEVRWLGRTRLDVTDARLQGPAGLTIAAASSAWNVAGLGSGDLRIALIADPTPHQHRLVLRRMVEPGTIAWTVEASDAPIGRLLDVRRYDRPLLDGGTMSGVLKLARTHEAVGFDVNVAARAARLPALASEEAEQEPLGRPTALTAQVAGSWSRDEGKLDVPRWRATVEGAALSGSIALRDLKSDPSVDLSLDVERMDFARLLRTSGLDAPEALGPESTTRSEGDLGSASLAARAQGRIAEPASFTVSQKIDFTPPTRIPQAIQRLRGPFVHKMGQEPGPVRTIDVSPSSPDFIPLSEVPPLFLRTLLIAEDAGFYSHPGIDLREMPAAILTDWARGRAARGASTITQQLAKNLFLSREKHLGRKLQELSVTLLLESALGKGRILEIYVNVIEWGPDLYGLKPAARAYFGREPKDLTPAQMAFLVSLIPAPVKYQSSFAHGTPGPGLRQLVDALLAKLRSVEALSEEDYQAALAESIVVQGRER